MIDYYWKKKDDDGCCISYPILAEVRSFGFHSIQVNSHTAGSLGWSGFTAGFGLSMR